MRYTNYEKLSKNRYRESYGFYYEDFTIGDVFEHRPGRTITETDNIWQSLLAMNTHPLHINHEYAANTEFQKPLVSSLVTFAIINGMTVNTLSAKAIANLGWDKVKLIKPVYVGDTLYAESEILNKRLSKSRPRSGIVTVSTCGIKSKNELVITFARTFLVPLRKYAITDEAN
jgi:itaconyl-CoA hydratase